MNLDGVLNVWGGGQLLTFSGIDGTTDYERGLLLRSVAGIAGFEVKLPEAGGLVAADFAPPAEVFLPETASPGRPAPARSCGA